MDIKVGIKGYYETVVSDENTAASYGSGLLDVFGTPHMVVMMEKAAHDSLLPYLDEGTGTVGTKLDISHVAASPVGIKVWAESTVTSVDGRSIEFEVKAYDEKGLIGEGIHRRAVIMNEKFMAKCSTKLNG